MRVLTWACLLVIKLQKPSCLEALRVQCCSNYDTPACVLFFFCFDVLHFIVFVCLYYFLSFIESHCIALHCIIRGVGDGGSDHSKHPSGGCAFEGGASVTDRLRNHQQSMRAMISTS